MSQSETQKNLEIDENFRRAANAMPAMVWVSGLDSTCLFFNTAWCEFTGRQWQEGTGTGWAQDVHADDYERCMGIYLSHFQEQKPFELEYRLKNKQGDYRWVIDKAKPWFGLDGNFSGYIGCGTDIHDSRISHDILEEKVAARTNEVVSQNQQIREQKEFSDMVFNATIDVIVIYGKQTEFLAVNAAAKKMYGFDEEIIGKKILDIYPEAKGSQGFEDLKRALAGETIHNSVYKSAVAGIYFENFLIPLKRDDEVYAVLVVARDITDRVKSENELKDLNKKLTSQNLDLQSSNEDLESFNYIASHDLQEPLRKVNMFAGRILEKDGNNLSEQSKDYFSRLTSATSRMQNLIQSLLEYSKMNQDEIRFTKTNLNKILKEVQSGLEEVIQEKKAVIESDDLPTISAVPLQIQQLLHNLVSNALKYSKPDVAPVVKIKAEPVKLASRDNKEFWKISVSDNGIGFDPEYKNKIFELFQRLHGKMEYEGTGVGLAICRKIANIHHGFIEAESEKGKGSAFNVYIPVKI